MYLFCFVVLIIIHKYNLIITINSHTVVSVDYHCQVIIIAVSGDDHCGVLVRPLQPGKEQTGLRELLRSSDPHSNPYFGRPSFRQVGKSL